MAWSQSILIYIMRIHFLLIILPHFFLGVQTVSTNSSQIKFLMFDVFILKGTKALNVYFRS